jgi:hypothetical protein
MASAFGICTEAKIGNIMTDLYERIGVQYFLNWMEQILHFGHIPSGGLDEMEQR